jgi:hypothetical protein
MTTRSTVSLQISALALAMFATACGGCASKPPPQPMPAPMPPQPMPPPVAQAAPCEQAQILAASTTMQARSAAEAPGMKPEGAPMCGVVNAPGETVSGPVFVIEPGYCYTFLGQSLPPVSEMEMVLQVDATQAAGALLPPNMAAMAQAPVLVSTTPGERVNMGEKKNCYEWSFLVPAPVKLVLRARAGAGPLAAQVYRKKKL